MYGLDVEPAFFDLGYELFRDRDAMHATFIAADLTKPSVASIETLASSIDIVSAFGIFHLFNLEDQKTVALNLVRLTKPKAGSMIIGRHASAMEAGERQRTPDERAFFLHNLESFDKLWQDIGAASGSKWKVDARTEKPPEGVTNLPWNKSDIMILIFTVRREKGFCHTLAGGKFLQAFLDIQ